LTRHFIEKNTRAARAFRHKNFPKHTRARANQSSSLSNARRRVYSPRRSLLLVASASSFAREDKVDDVFSSSSRTSSSRTSFAKRRRRKQRRRTSFLSERGRDEVVVPAPNRPAADRRGRLENDRPVRAVGAKLPRVVRERVRAFFLRVVRVCVMWAFFSLSLVFSRYSLNAHLSMSLLLLLRKIKNTRERSDDVDRLRRQSSAV
jgi:hypothetical protein